MYNMKNFFILIAFTLVVSPLGVVLHASPQENPASKESKPDAKKLDTERLPSGRFSFVKDRHDDEILKLSHDKSIFIRVTDSDGGKWLLPVYEVAEMTLPKPRDTNPTMTVKMIDSLLGPQAEMIELAMDSKYGKGWNKATPTQNVVDVWLTLTVGKKMERLARDSFIRTPNKHEHHLKFSLTTETAARLLAADGANFGLCFEENYNGTFAETDLKASVSVAQSVATQFKNKLGKTAEGKEAMLLVAIGGHINNTVNVDQLLGRQVIMGIMMNRNKPVNQTLIDNLLTKLFDGVKSEIELSKEKDNTIVTYVTSNGIRATSSIGTIKRISDAVKKENESKNRTERTRTWLRKVGTTAKGDALFGIASAEFKLDLEDGGTNIDNEDKWARALSDMTAAVDGELPTACLTHDQVQKVVANASSVTTVDIGSFVEGQKLIVSLLGLDLNSRVNTRAPLTTTSDKEAERIQPKSNVSQPIANTPSQRPKEVPTITHINDILTNNNKSYGKNITGTIKIYDTFTKTLTINDGANDLRIQIGRDGTGDDLEGRIQIGRNSKRIIIDIVDALDMGSSIDIQDDSQVEILVRSGAVFRGKIGQPIITIGKNCQVTTNIQLTEFKQVIFSQGDGSTIKQK